MSDPFFTKKRKRSAPKNDRLTSRGPQRAKRAPKDDEISSESDTNNANEAADYSDAELSETSEILDETPAEKRLRIAKNYLGKVSHEIADGEGFDAAEIDNDLISARLEKDNLAHSGKLYLRIAAAIETTTIPTTTSAAREKSCITTAVRHGDHVYATYKSGTIQKWHVDPRGVLSLKKTVRRAHTKAVLCSTVNHDGTRLATGSVDNTIIMWDTEHLTNLRTFNNHRDSVNSLSFPLTGDELFSASSDRTVKLFNSATLSYIESLFGHQDHISCLSSLSATTCVTTGSRDRSARLWKIVDESQLVFRGGDRKERFQEGSIDVCAQVDRELFVTGSDNGTVALWSTQKKKALCRLPATHGTDRTYQVSAEAVEGPENMSPENARWVTAIHAIPYSDLVLSGSWDGRLNLYQVSEDARKLVQVGTLATGRGIVNSIAAHGNDKEGWNVVVAVGYETRLGRWKTVGGARNGILSFKIEASGVA
ncbi:Ribosomal RNA-processing protein [Taphrina deformans PYCC 5710]|uniref:Ribosomal RNA-processing protein n=1 Tax=Taphrina deformans (strain PYCC 5710 / ATCC 11124 / CBS 356.35 / IMI 108563 / JCM 9778 / NBRC 8474) TaxID=1097556 RepID=R4XB23_TAPDE|nr:Ribosomal RNA-processing protein [Taphrina deformans PYCC 5710]|eukprot:CCG83023.1 Ribosomal RNA-processing protein [Taphrina deformans PYCC 5710]